MKNAHKILLSSPLECGLCGIEEDTPDELDEHISLHSNRLEYQCVECEYVGSATKLLRQHMRSHVSNWKYSSELAHISWNPFLKLDTLELLRLV